jgi:hypothetical protein
VTIQDTIWTLKPDFARAGQKPARQVLDDTIRPSEWAEDPFWQFIGDKLSAQLASGKDFDLALSSCMLFAFQAGMLFERARVRATKTSPDAAE